MLGDIGSAIFNESEKLTWEEYRFETFILLARIKETLSSIEQIDDVQDYWEIEAISDIFKDMSCILKAVKDYGNPERFEIEKFKYNHYDIFDFGTEISDIDLRNSDESDFYEKSVARYLITNFCKDSKNGK